MHDLSNAGPGHLGALSRISFGGPASPWIDSLVFMEPDTVCSYIPYAFNLYFYQHDVPWFFYCKLNILTKTLKVKLLLKKVIYLII